MDGKIHVSFRFHVNMYHSYRGESLDENGIGKDIRIIKNIVEVLNFYNDKGIEVKGTWDVENYYTLERIMPKYCPELLEDVKKRKQRGDEIEAMSYNNGILTSLDTEEAKLVLSEMITNEKGSGLMDVFGDFAPIIRPQECMMSSSLIPLLKNVGIQAVSLYYSSVPFNAFSNFIKPLSTNERYNPLTLKSSISADTITLLPSVNNGDILFGGGIKRYVKVMRKKQRAENLGDLMLIVDMDADDEFWYGYMAKKTPEDGISKGGLYKMIKALSKLPYVEFSTPYEYMKSHETVGEVTLPLDTADGSHDGYSSWAEKWENTSVWKKIEKSRFLCFRAHEIAKSRGKADPPEIAEARRKRVLALSTTHFGLASPIVNKERIEEAERLAGEALALSEKLLEGESDVYADNPYVYMGDGASSLVFVERDNPHGRKYMLNGKLLQSFKVPYKNEDGVILQNVSGKIDLKPVPYDDFEAVTTNAKSIENKLVRVSLTPGGGIRLYYKDDLFIKRALKPQIRYGNKLYRGEMTGYSTYDIGGVKMMKVVGDVKLPHAQKGKFKYTVTITSDLPSVYFDGFVDIPETEHKGYDKKKAKRLNKTYDNRFKEVMPFEIYPAFTASDKHPFLVTKHNFFGDQSRFAIDFGVTTHNRRIDSFNNAITCGYTALSNGEKGIMIAQNVFKDNNFAFCPMRISYLIGEYSASLNPLGTYHGKQLKNVLSKSELSTYLATKAATQFDSYAPSYNGKRVEASFMITPFYGEGPTDEMVRNAFLFAYPPVRK